MGGWVRGWRLGGSSGDGDEIPRGTRNDMWGRKEGMDSRLRGNNGCMGNEILRLRCAALRMTGGDGGG